MAETICWIQHTIKKRNRKNGGKDEKALYNLMNNAAYEKIMENVRNISDVKLVSNKKDYLKWTSKSSYMAHKIFDNDLVAICKNKVTLTINKPAYIGCLFWN